MFASKNTEMTRTYIFAALALVALSCSDDDEAQDTTKPVILAATVNGEDHDLEFNAGDALQLEVDLSDNEDLSQFKIEVHDIFDGHDHNKVLDGDAWELTEIINVTGANATVNHTLSVPNPVTAGPHHFIFRVLDAAGNESEFMEMDFILKNGEEPTFSISDPDFSNEVPAPKGQSLAITGTINDDEDLAEVIITIEEEEEHNHKNASGAIIFSYDADLAGTSDTSFDLSTVDIAIPATSETGHYELKISAKDNEGNYGVFTAELDVM